MATTATTPTPAPSSGGLFHSIGHFFASVGKAIVSAFKGAQTVIPVVVQDLTEAEQVAAGIVALLPAADQATVTKVENAAFAVLGNAAVAVNGAITAAGGIAAAIAAGGLNVVLDVGAIQAVQAALPAFGKLLTAPTTPPATASSTVGTAAHTAAKVG